MPIGSANVRVLVIVPTYNERDNVESLVTAAHENLREADILIVDDASPDGTGAVADAMAARDSRVHVLHRGGTAGLARGGARPHRGSDRAWPRAHGRVALRFQPQLTPKESEQFITTFQKQQMANASNGLGVALRKAWQITPKVWTLTTEGALWPIAVRLGISDDQFSELHDDSLQEGQELIIGLNDNDGRGASSGPPASTSRPPPVRF